MVTGLAAMGSAYTTDKFDKGQVPHHYDLVYDPLFQSRRFEELTILELGVFEGQSLALWRDFFPKSKVYGIDMVLPPPIRGVKMFQGEQGDAAFLEGVAKEVGPFDIIIDDCSHIGRLTNVSFRVLSKHLRPGGIFAIEDLGAELSPRFHDREPFTKTGLAEVLFLAQKAKTVWREIRVAPSLMVFIKA